MAPHGNTVGAMSGVLWSQGLFLQPQHFQQEARHRAHCLDLRVRAAAVHAWGFFELVLDESQLAVGRVALLRASGILPDGTPFSAPQFDDLPPAYQVPPDLAGEHLLLALPLVRPGGTEVDWGDGRAEAGSAPRYRVLEQTLRDQTQAGDDPEPVQLAGLALRLLRARDAGAGHACLGVARVLERRADSQVMLDRAYIAPQTRLDASGQLVALADLLHGLMRQRAEMVAALMGQGQHGVAEVASFMLLQTLNRTEPWFRELTASPSAHPQDLHRACLQLAGELASFNDGVRVAPIYPAYRHDDLQASFAPLVEDLRRHLSAPIDRRAEPIELTEHKHGMRTAQIADAELLRSASFVLAVRADMPSEQLRQRFASHSKLGPVAQIRDLVNRHLPGVSLRSLPAAPRQLPYHAGAHYFELERHGPLWQQLQASGALALHVAGDFPGLGLELWAIRA